MFSKLRVSVFEVDGYLIAEPGYEFDKTLLTKYNHMSFGGPPVTVETVEEADELNRNEDKESAIGKHPKFQYSFFLLSVPRLLFCQLDILIFGNGYEL